jgi:hypothetical protein
MLSACLNHCFSHSIVFTHKLEVMPASDSGAEETLENEKAAPEEEEAESHAEVKVKRTRPAISDLLQAALRYAYDVDGVRNIKKDWSQEHETIAKKFGVEVKTVYGWLTRANRNKKKKGEGAGIITRKKSASMGKVKKKDTPLLDRIWKVAPKTPYHCYNHCKFPLF